MEQVGSRATLTLTNGSVSVTITNPGTGYTNTNPPLVHIGEPTLVREEMNVDGYSGDYGTIVGVGNHQLDLKNNSISTCISLLIRS